MKNLISISILFLLLLLVSAGCSKSDENPVGNNSPASGVAVIYNPVVRELWKPGNEYQIKWSFPATVEEVNIIVLKKKQYNVLTIQKNAVNDGKFIWRIPANIVQSVSYQIKIENSADPTHFIYSEVFEISNR